MSAFTYLRPSRLDEAVAALGDAGSVAIGGGTDLLTCIEEGLAAPGRVVDIRDLAELRGISAGPAGGLRIGAAVRIADLASDPQVAERYPLLAAAARSVGSPALRNSGTVGGSLAQRQRCWYLRRGVACFKNGGTQCAAVEGEHSYHGIFTDGPCRAVHPSDPAVALDALGARVVTTARTLAIDELFAGAGRNPRSETVLADGELILAVELPAAAAGGTQFWEKVIQRGAFDFALVSIAASRRSDGSVRMAMGGLAAASWRLPLSIEEDVASGGLDEESLDALAERAFYDASPLPGTVYKVRIAQALLHRAMRALGARNHG